MSNRKSINVSDSFQDIAVKLADGNAGALSVVMQVMKADPLDGFAVILHLDDMNMRGSQIWAGYSYHCGQDIDKFVAAVKARDADMVEAVNGVCTGAERATVSGGSYR